MPSIEVSALISSLPSILYSSLFKKDEFGCWRSIFGEEKYVTILALDYLSIKRELHRCFSFEAAGLNPLCLLIYPDLGKVERIKIVMRYLAKVFASELKLG